MLFNSSLKRDTIFYGTATLCERLISLLIIPLLTKTLPQEFYGVWTQIIVTTTLVSNVVLVGFGVAAVRFLAGDKSDGEISRIFNIMLIAVVINSLVVMGFTLVFTGSLNNAMFGETRFAMFVLLFGVYVGCESLFELVAAFLRARKEILRVSIYYLIKNIFRIVSLAIGILLFRLDMFQAIIIMISFQIILVMVIYTKDILKKVGFGISLVGVPWKEILFFSIPIVPYNLLISANFLVSRYFILHILNIKQVSIYAVAYSISAIIGLFYSVLGFTLYPHLAAFWNNGDKIATAEIFQQGLKYYIFFAVPSIAIFSILGSSIIKILSTAEYVSNWQVLFATSGAIAFFGIYQLYCYITLLAKKTILNLAIACISLLVNIILNIMLIPRMGILGAAIALFVANTALALSTSVIAKKYLTHLFPWTVTGRMFLATIVISLFLLSARHYFDMDNIYLLIFACIGAMAIYGTMDLFSKNSVLLQLRRNI